jgi:hypothetical protein
MPELPSYMKKAGRSPDQTFLPDEMLYRRVRPEVWDDDDIPLDAIEFPDMSVTREKYGPPEAARWEFHNYLDWGVVGFRVSDIPPETIFQGAFIYRMRPSHEPTKINYPHSEVQVFESSWGSPMVEIRIDRTKISGVTREARQEWREMLRRACQAVLKPYEKPDPSADDRYLAKA